MTSRLVRLMLVLALLLAVPAEVAGAAKQIKARKGPKVTGPLTETGKGCDGETVRAEGRLIARVEACVFFYAFDSLAEVDVLRDYGVAWVQLTFDAGSGFCADQVGITMQFPEGTEIRQTAPERAIVTSRSKRAGASLSGIGGSFALEDSSISQKFTALPTSLRSFENGSEVSVEWLGHSAAKIPVVGGAEISWMPVAPMEEFNAAPGVIRMTRC